MRTHLVDPRENRHGLEDIAKIPIRVWANDSFAILKDETHTCQRT